MEVGTTAYEVMGTVADATLPTVTVTASDETPISPVVVTLDATYSKRWIATFDLPAVADTLTLSANRNDGTDDVTKTFAILVHDSSVNPYPVATINLNDFEITETGSYPDSPLNDTLSLSGTCQADATVNLLFNNQEAITDAPCVAGIWNHDVTLSPGKNFITLTVTDDSLALPLTTTAYDAVWYLLP